MVSAVLDPLAAEEELTVVSAVSAVEEELTAVSAVSAVEAGGVNCGECSLGNRGGAEVSAVLNPLAVEDHV